MEAKELYDICEVLSRELGEANNKIRQSGGKLSGSDLDYVDKLTHALKSVKTTLAMVESEEGSSGYYPIYGRSYNDGSYARRRDSMGRYSSRYSRDNYSRDDEMIAELRELMETAPDERTKQEFKRFISKIERM